MSDTSSSSGSSVDSYGSSEDLMHRHHQKTNKKTSLAQPSGISSPSEGISKKTQKALRTLPSSNTVDRQAHQEDNENMVRSRPLQSHIDSDANSHSSEYSNAEKYNKSYNKGSSFYDAGKQQHVVKVEIKKESREGNKLTNEDVIYHPQPCDILLGRGKGVSETAGNIRFQRLVESHADRYIATARQSRGEYCGTIVKQAQDEWGARFLEPASGGGWKLADLDKARKKVGQAVRYRLRQLPDAPPIKKPKNIPAPAESKVSKKTDELLLLKHSWNQSIAAKHSSLSAAPCPLALLGSVAAASSGFAMAPEPRLVAANSMKNKSSSDTDEDSLAEENRNKDTRRRNNASQRAADKFNADLATMRRPVGANSTELNRVLGAAWTPGMMSKHAVYPFSAMPISNNPRKDLEARQGRNVSSSVHEDEINHSGNAHESKVNKRTFSGEDAESASLHSKKQKTTSLTSLDNMSMEDCIEIMSSASLAVNCGAEDVNHALRNLRRQVVDSAEDESTDEDAGWKFVCLHRGIPLVIHCMSLFASHAGIQSNACFLLSEILRLSDKKQPENGPEASYSFGLIMQAAGVIEAVLHAMREHVRDRLVNNNALAMLSTFTRELKRPQKELERTLVSQCVVPQVLLALQAFGADVKIARHTGNILWNLSIDAASRRIMVEAGAATIVSLAILQVPREFKAQFTSLHLRILQDYFYHGGEDDEDDDEERYSFHPAAIMSSASPFQKR